jgi:putative phage-type endonuclease
MSTIVNLVQGSTEWHEHRRNHRNASETPIVLGVSPWCTPYQLWQQKLGLAKPEVNGAMLRGTELEPAARAAYERLTGLTMKPSRSSARSRGASAACGGQSRRGHCRTTISGRCSTS